MKILCVCQFGNSRSVALGWILKDYKHDALSMGIDSASEETQKMLFDWADRIILVDKDYYERIPEKYREKLRIWDVGKDRYFQPPVKELIDQYFKHWMEQGL